MPIEPVKIPQNVYIEDRIVGPLTLRQIIIMAIGGGISYAIFGSIQKSLGAVPVPLMILAWTPAAVAGIFALVKINDLSITRILLLLLESTQKPSHRTWAPRTGISINFRTTPKAQDEKPKKAEPAAVRPEQQIRELSTTVDKLWSAENENQAPQTPQIITPTFTITDHDLKPSANEKSESPPSGLSIFRDLLPPSSPQA